MDPAFDIVATLKPMLQQTVLQRYAPAAVRQRLLALGGEALDAGEELPQTLRLLVRRLKRGRLNADINVSNLGQLSKALERAAVTLAIAIVTAAFCPGAGALSDAFVAAAVGHSAVPAVGGAACLAGVVLLALRLRR